MIYDYYKEKGKKGFKGKFIAGIIAIIVFIAAIIASNIYIEITQLKEIGSILPSIYIKNILYRLFFM